MAKMEDEKHGDDQDKENGEVADKTEQGVTLKEHSDGIDDAESGLQLSKKSKKKRKKKKKKKEKEIDVESDNAKTELNDSTHAVDSKIDENLVNGHESDGDTDDLKNQSKEQMDLDEESDDDEKELMASNHIAESKIDENLVNGHGGGSDNDDLKHQCKEEIGSHTMTAEIVQESGDETNPVINDVIPEGQDSDTEPSEQLHNKYTKKSDSKVQTSKKYDKDQYLTDRRQSIVKIEKYQQGVKQMQFESRDAELSYEERLQKLVEAADELTLLEDELERRFQQCQEYKDEIEEAEKYFDRRQDIVNSKEEDLVQLDEELEILHQELEKDKAQLSSAGVKVEEVITPSPRNRVVAYTSHDEDYILKVNIRKLQGELKTAEQTMAYKDEELSKLKQQVLELQLDRRKKDQRIKHLETQLQIALGQLNHRQSMADTSANSSMVSDRARSARRHVSLDRMNSNAELSINQVAQLNRAKRMNSATGSMASISKLTESTAVKSTRNSDDGTEVGDAVKSTRLGSSRNVTSRKAVSSTCVIL
ncbi:putative leucine-rich repeat-containing protein DDB_G0290503 isoform X2 [Ptychodera flava]|uniref:putative leucine-rich repeat-containing protein DDB_G0290503 isoform X2 n=1 Tax=Ptychodera flava TaxID=63121 RepID=UPI00396A73FE